MSTFGTREHQMFPVLESGQLEIASRFASGPAQKFASGAVVFDIGELGAPAWLVLAGSIDVVRRDGLSHEAVTSMEWAGFIRAQNLEHSMSRRGNCHDNAVAESFFSLLKRERIRRCTYETREEARQDAFDYVEMFYQPCTQAGQEQDAVARRVRTAAGFKGGRRLEN